MEAVKKLYLQAYFFVMALYVFFNKGIAYSFLAEALWAGGFIVLFLTRKSYAFGWDKRTKILAFFLAVTLGYIGWGLRSYALFDVIRDSFVIQYAWFAFFVFLFKDLRAQMWEYIIKIYTWFPFFALLNFYLQNFSEFFENFILFGSVPFALYKYGDMGVHLLISSLVLMLYLNNRSIRFQVTIAVAILLNLLIITAYSRSGMLAYLISLGLFVFYTKREEMRILLKQYARYLPIILLIVLPLYASIKVKENFQGRKVGMEQLVENVGSIFGVSKDATLDENKFWRLVWWANIIDYSITPEYALQGKGLGMSLAESDDVVTEIEDLRSPHNFNLTILARFGWPLFLLWAYWLFCLFKPMFKRQLNDQQLMISCVLFTFWLNGSFDVFLEGPMGAFPFWTWVGLYFLGDFFQNRNWMKHHKVDILGTPVSSLTMDELFSDWEAVIQQGQKAQVCITPVNSILAARATARVQTIYKHADYVLCDSVPVKWASEFLGTPIKQRITGLDVLPRIFPFALKNDFSIFLLGASPGVAETLKQVMEAKFPGVKIVGIFVPPFRAVFSEEENQQMIQAINAVKPDILLVSLTAPKQDIWIAENLSKLDTQAAIGIGGAFEVAAGMIKRAPVWMQKAGLEWFYRFLQEPKRMFKRYFLEAPVFIPLIIQQKFNKRFGLL